jgi:hypothetical protein
MGIDNSGEVMLCMCICLCNLISDLIYFEKGKPTTEGQIMDTSKEKTPRQAMQGWVKLWKEWLEEAMEEGLVKALEGGSGRGSDGGGFYTK